MWLHIRYNQPDSFMTLFSMNISNESTPCTLHTLKKEIENKTDLHPGLQRLFHNDQYLADTTQTLDDYSLRNGDDILCSGPGEAVVKFVT